MEQPPRLPIPSPSAYSAQRRSFSSARLRSLCLSQADEARPRPWPAGGRRATRRARTDGRTSLRSAEPLGLGRLTPSLFDLGSVAALAGSKTTAEPPSFFRVCALSLSFFRSVRPSVAAPIASAPLSSSFAEAVLGRGGCHATQLDIQFPNNKSYREFLYPGT